MSKSANGDAGTPAPRDDAAPPQRTSAVSRRSVLAGSAALLPLVNVSCTTAQAPAPVVLSVEQNAVLDAFADRIVPPDEHGPGAAASGVTRYINRSLAEWNQADLPLVGDGLTALDAASRAQHMQGFATLGAEQQDALLLAMETGQLAGFANAQALFNRLHRLVLEGMFSDPYYGGNVNYAGWDLIGYPGAVLGSTADMQRMGTRLPPLHTSAYGEEHDGH